MLLKGVLELEEIDIAHSLHAKLLGEAEVVRNGGAPNELSGSHLPLLIDEVEEGDFLLEDS